MDLLRRCRRRGEARTRKDAPLLPFGHQDVLVDNNILFFKLTTAADQDTRVDGSGTHLESLCVRCNLTAWFVVEQGVPEHEREVGVRVEWVLVAVLFYVGAYAVEAAWFWDDLHGWMR